MSHPAAINNLSGTDWDSILPGYTFLVRNMDETYWRERMEGSSPERDEAHPYTKEEFQLHSMPSVSELTRLTLEVLPPEGSAPAATPEPTGEYQPPYPPAEETISETDRINAFARAHPDRHFLVSDKSSNTYWSRPTGQMGPHTGGPERSKAGVWLGSEITNWGFGGCEAQMLPLRGSRPIIPEVEVPLEEQTPGQALFSLLNANATHPVEKNLYGSKAKAKDRLREVFKIRSEYDLSRLENGYTDSLGLIILAAMWSGEGVIIGDDYQALKALVDKAHARLAKALLPVTNPTKQQLAQAVAKTYNYE